MMLPQPIPYQGSKRKIAPTVLKFIPEGTQVLYEPFAGSAAVTIAAAVSRQAKSFVIGDSLGPLIKIWEQILESPKKLADNYEQLWNEQIGQERAFFDQIRSEFNQKNEPHKLLYLIARCVKNAVRFNANGEFNQSPDNRRKGMRPETLRKRILEVAEILGGKTTALHCDFEITLADVSSEDFVYMDPPYQGTSLKKDQRYFEQLNLQKLIGQMENLNKKKVPFVLSFDGNLGDKIYGSPLPDHLGLKRILIDVGRSSQATLLGRDENTVESLYISPSAVRRNRLNKDEEKIILESPKNNQLAFNSPV